MNKQTQIIVIMLFVILVGWLLIHKKDMSPTLTTAAPDIELKETPTLAPTAENLPPKNVVLAKQPPSEILLTEKDKGKTLAIKKGETFTISLAERIGGYDSISISYKASILDLIDHGFVSSTIPGDPGSRIWTFKAIEYGTTDITIKANPNKEDSSQTIFAYTVEVAK